MIYIAVLCNSTESLQNHSTILPLFIGPYAAATVRRFSMKALARYQVILRGEQFQANTTSEIPQLHSQLANKPLQQRSTECQNVGKQLAQMSLQ